jgi:hypothetical protein
MNNRGRKDRQESGETRKSNGRKEMSKVKLVLMWLAVLALSFGVWLFFVSVIHWIVD